jgi:hypothetical protein
MTRPHSARTPLRAEFSKLEVRSSTPLIGGVFPLQVASSGSPDPPFLAGGELLFVNARSAVAAVVELTAAERVWVPSYLCDSLYIAVSRPGVQVRFYPVGPGLRLVQSTWVDEVLHGDLVVVIAYFGFRTNESCVASLRERGARVLEDAAQALLTEGVGTGADFVVYSPRKFLGVPDGGILASKAPLDTLSLPLEPPPHDWWSIALSAVTLRREYDRIGGDRRWVDLFQQSETEAPIGPYAMSELSRNLLLNGFDYPEIARKRVENYRVLSERLAELAIFPELPDSAVPLGFPIRLPNRDRVRLRLFREEIYPPVHWRLEGIVPTEYHESHRLADEIMTLPCDQRYDSADMERLSAAVCAGVRR